MSIPQITYRGMPHSPAMDARILDLAAKLDDLHPKITRCHVVVGETERHKDKLFEVHIDVHAPGSEVVATKHANADPYVALSDAFEAVTRQLEDTVRRDHGGVRSHHDDPVDKAAS
jgi:ribosome-associated translation inhibitor RaiA